jgi:hypothetical protein
MKPVLADKHGFGVAAGRIPVVMTPAGRREAPRRVAIELRRGRASRTHPIAATIPSPPGSLLARFAAIVLGNWLGDALF